MSFQEEDLHSYVVTSDGRAYTAVSKMNDSIGFDLQPLSMLGGVVGWLFARSTSTSAPNGYQLTGTIHAKKLFYGKKLDRVPFFGSGLFTPKEESSISQRLWISPNPVTALSSNNGFMA